MQNVKVTRKGKGVVAPRIYLLFARKSPTAVIFRRGPSDWYQLLKWNTEDDSFERGQWFHGRLYERRSDLSPDGALLIYFARKITGRTLEDKEYTYAWTAISKPPFLTALALWPKGDCWHGGGLFKDDTHVELNHPWGAAKPHPGHQPEGIHVRLRNNVHGEDEPLYADRLERDGWKLQTKWVVENLGHPEMLRTHQPEVREKKNPINDAVIRLVRSIHGLDYAEEFILLSGKSDQPILINEASWVDWDQKGRLVFARQGKIFAGSLSDEGTLIEHLLIDLNGEKPANVPPSISAAAWEPERPTLSRLAKFFG